MDKKIFISHSSLDTEIGEKFVDALIDIGIPKEIIFFSSRYHTGVELGKDFHAVIKDNIKSCDIVIFLLTRNFYNSAACLNEMGAAWVLGKNIIPILLDNLKPSDMKGFIDSHYIAFMPKAGEEYKLLSKLNPYIVKRNTEKTLQEIFTDFVQEANKIAEFSDQYITPISNDLSFLETEIIGKRFTDAEILFLNYFRIHQNNIFLEFESKHTQSDFQKYVEEYSKFNYDNAANLLEDSGYISTSISHCDDHSGQSLVYNLDIEYFRQLISIGTVAEKYIEEIKLKHKRSIIKTLSSNDSNSNVFDKYILDDNTREIEVLLVAYAYDKLITSFGDRWMASGTIAGIQTWERENNVSDKLSQNYYTALNLLINRGILDVASCTSYGNPREYKFRDEYARDLLCISQESKKLLSNTKQANYHLYQDEELLPF